MDRLDTPALLLDLDALDANIATATRLAAAKGMALRPHAKSHKSPDIARRLVDAGALGASVATLGEAEALAAAGIPGLLLTSPVASVAQVERVAALLGRGADLLVVCDAPESVDALAAAARGAGRALPLLVEIDVGQGRTGVAGAVAAVALARRIAEAEGAAFAGVQGYWGQMQQVGDWQARRAGVKEQARAFRAVLDALDAAGLPAGIVTGGGTGSFGLDLDLGLFTELQPGSFLFLDSVYGPLAILEGGNPFRHALAVRATVISRARLGDPAPKAIVNAGYKALSTDSGPATVAAGAPPGTTYRFMGDEHGGLLLPKGGTVEAGAEVDLVPSNCDPTVNQYPVYHLHRGGVVEGTWPVRGRYGDRA